MIRKMKYFSSIIIVFEFICLSILPLGCGEKIVDNNKPTEKPKDSIKTKNAGINIIERNVSLKKPESFVFKGAHPPGGCRGACNDYYYWIWGYGPASTCQQPEFYDVNSGKLIFKNPHTYLYVKVFDKYIILYNKLDLNEGESTNTTYVYENNKLLLTLSERLVYIDNDLYCIEKDNVLIFKRITDDATLDKHKIENGYFAPLDQDIPSTILIISDKKSYLLDTITRKRVLDVPFDLGHHPEKNFMKISNGYLYDVDLEKRIITRLKPTKCLNEYEVIDVNRAFDNNKSILYDIETGKQVAFLDNFRYGINRMNIILFTNGYDGKRFYAYSTINGKQLWTYETKGISGALVYGDKLIYVEDETNKTICIDINTGKTIWETNDVYLSYYSTFFNGNDAYDYDYVNVGNGYLIKLDLETGKTLFKKQIEDLSYIDFENDVFYTIQYEKEPKKYQLKDFERIW